MRRVALVAGMLTFVGLVAAQESAPTSDASPLSRTVTVGGLKREYLLHIPKKLGKDNPLPIVFVFHGGTGEAAQQEKLTGFAALAARERFVVVYPQGVGRSWNDGRVTTVTKAHRDGIDDVAFFDAMLAAVAKDYPIDEKRVYATGISNGGMFSHYLAAHRADKLAAIAPVVGGIADPFHRKFKPTDPVSVLIIQGTKDPLVPYDGGGTSGWKDRGRLIGTDEAVRLWVRNNGCAEKPVASDLPDRDPADGCAVRRFVWAEGRGGTEVVLLRVENGGHTWPGGPQYLPERFIGRVCRDFDATAVIWEFFKSHAKP